MPGGGNGHSAISEGPEQGAGGAKGANIGVHGDVMGMDAQGGDQLFDPAAAEE